MKAPPSLFSHTCCSLRKETIDFIGSSTYLSDEYKWHRIHKTEVNSNVEKMRFCKTANMIVH